MSEAKRPAIDDRPSAVSESSDSSSTPVRSTFVMTKIDALEKPRLAEELIEPDGGSACSCNTVCPCVPDEICVCNTVCTCDTVETCASYSSGGGGGGGGAGGYYAPCH